MSSNYHQCVVSVGGFRTAFIPMVVPSLCHAATDASKRYWFAFEPLAVEQRLCHATTDTSEIFGVSNRRLTEDGRAGSVSCDD